MLCAARESKLDQPDQLVLRKSLPIKIELLASIDRLALSADAKAIISRLADITAEIGGAIVQVGRRILTFVLECVKLFPNTAFGVIVALVVSMLIASIPFLGVVLGPLLTPLLVAFGLAAGALADLREGALRARIMRLEAEFRALTAAA